MPVSTFLRLRLSRWHSGVRAHTCARCRETVALAPGSGGRLGAVPQASATMARGAGRGRPGPAPPAARRAERPPLVATELIGRDVPSADARVYAPADSCCWG